MTSDHYQRPLKSLRISVTDRCNLRCGYCMPERDYVWLPKSRLLDFDEITTVAMAFAALGVERIRLTGGEPLLRSDLPVLVRKLAEIDGIADVSLTTNGVLLAQHCDALRAAGLRRVTISLDTQVADRFAVLSGRDEFERTCAGLRAAVAARFTAVKVNTVVMRGENDDEIVPMLEFGRRAGAEVRFIEYMDVGGATRWQNDKVVARSEILDRVESHYGPLRPLPGRGSAPAETFELPDGMRFGVIASTTEPFCGSCDRARLTADGNFFLCLYARRGVDLRAVVRAGATVQELATLIGSSWAQRRDRGAEERLALSLRAPLAAAEELRENPHLEMHTRGG